MNGGGFEARIEALVVDQWFRDPPPFLRAMASNPTMEIARAFVLEWTKFSRWFPRWVGAVMSNCPELDVLAFEVENLMSEVVRDPAAKTNHYELLIQLGAGAGLGREEIELHRPSAETVAAFAYWNRMARQGEWLIGFTAINGLEIMGDRNVPRRHGLTQGTGLGIDPWAATGLDEKALEFFRVSDEADAAHGGSTVAIMARYTPANRESEVLGVLSDSIGHLRRMMDGLWALAHRSAREGQ